MNLLKSSNYSFIYSNPQIMDISEHLQEFQTPNLILSDVSLMQPTANMYIVGDTITFGEINMTVLIDEKMELYKAMLDEMIAHSNQETKETDLSRFVGTLIITTNKGTPIFKIIFKDCFINSVGPLTFSETQEDNHVVTDISMRFTSIDYESLTV